MNSIARLSRYVVLVVTFFFVSLKSFSQKKEFKGYYINLSGDTIRGAFVNYKQWSNNPDRVSFVPTTTGIASQLTPATCKSFEINNYDTYISYHGTRLTNPVDFANAPTGNTADTYDTINTFLRQIAASEQLKLYVYKDDLRMNLFYAVNNNINELLQKGNLINNSFWESMRYKQQLKEIFTSEPDKEKIDQLIYTEESLASFVNKQNKGKSSFKKDGGPNNGRFVIFAGASLNSLKFSGDKSQVYSNKEYPTTTAPVVAIGYILPINRNFHKFFLFPQIKLSAFKHTATTFFNSTTAYPAQVNTFQSSPTVSVGFHFGYNIINKSDFKLFIAPGGGITILCKNKQVDNIQFSATEQKTIITTMPTTTYLLDTQAGAVIHEKYFAWLSYNFPTTITSYSANRGILTSIQFGLGYKL
ncbi:hypothetical protein [Segetibacter aerophilus]|uniref:Outer membrane protein beta-barrel domain-containing protein n=1 Tax=Segetibacter aerophilus TaxID=670293 RepID=A0A512B6T7_9BACT|nr:hypothetical protein [Segetibacter aerophilus]GEO07693.1 hypothetical protein SAE01_01890 [Segetibacter aerophilus]